ncbi:Phenol hydroxylase-like dimerisation [Rubrobacter xylanophilus DSM 9941]|uniref:Phenol hydroxylase-like dimerisation n=1 Tax=Rubrobacter xylanophilus (strain DSM 9941 / JCM 11954 / NBRC 16129 / PRD-1) TaxID=266117 RepID=Q1AYT1_RUBXD|nr:FAD-binding monooxygenase [Rubrobacter xylanophilus]ABG03447.1 Phenol hydroxylase-like dimerisation [Rubrobacter xylanophilus DSM 9941]
MQQFHLNGFKVGDPFVHEAVGEPVDPEVLPEAVDVLIVGCGPAGLTLATQLAAFPEIRVRIVERKGGPLELGQADGIACRTMEMFEAFGFSERVLKEACWINETVFWEPDAADRRGIVRSGRIQDTEDGLSEFPHVVLNQARVHEFYLDAMRKSPTRLVPNYSRRLVGLEVGEGRSGAGDRDHPVKVTLERTDPEHAGETETVRARYVVGCDGAHSTVRKLLGLSMKGDSANQLWGVMDVLAVTDFPDVRMKAVIHSSGGGNLLIIPREGGYLVRLYIELGRPGERFSREDVTAGQLVEAARRILHPYTLEVKEIAWWSVYEIGQRLCDRFDDVPEEEAGERFPRVFIAGDACHTHSPKAGQVMNVSMADAFNLGWKLASVLLGRSKPELLYTYSAERRAVAQELIDFDREFARMISAPPKATGDDDEGIDPKEFQEYFVKQGRFTAGVATRYGPSLITAEPVHQDLARGFVVGTRFHSAPVIRLSDAKPVQLGHAVKADGRWRVFAFADREDPADPSSAIQRLCRFLAGSPESPVLRHTPKGADIDSVIDVRAVFQQGHRELALEKMPPFLLPRKGRYGLVDYEKMFCPDLKGGEDIFELRGIDRERGCLVVVRPDQYVAQVLPLDAHEGLAAFFARFMLGAGRHGRPSNEERSAMVGRVGSESGAGFAGAGRFGGFGAMPASSRRPPGARG